MTAPTVLLLALLSAQAQTDPDALQGLWKPVDLELKDVPAAETFRRLFEAGGISTELPDEIPEKPLSVSLRGATFWQAADELLRRHGGLRYGLHNPLALEVAPGSDAPAVYRGPFRIEIYDVARIRESRFPRNLNRTEVAIGVQWMPQLRVARNSRLEAGHVHLTRATDDAGRSLLPEVDPGKEFDFPNVDSQGIHARWLFRLASCAGNIKKLSRIEGEWEGAVLTDIQRVRFENPLASVGRSEKVGPMTLTLTECKRIERAVSDQRIFTVRFVLSFDPATAPAACKAGLAAVPLGARAVIGESADPREESDPMLLIDEQHKNDNETGLWGTLFFHEDAPREIVVRIALNARSVRLPFSFENIPLPEDKP